MAEAEVGPNEDIERALKRFKRQVKDEGIIQDFRSREFYEKPSEYKKKLKAKKRRQKRRDDDF